MPRYGLGHVIVGLSCQLDGAGQIEDALHAGRVEGQDGKINPVAIHPLKPLVLEVEDLTREIVPLTRFTGNNAISFQRLGDRTMLFEGDFLLHASSLPLPSLPASAPPA